jgi:hypothetical protein
LPTGFFLLKITTDPVLYEGHLISPHK